MLVRPRKITIRAFILDRVAATAGTAHNFVAAAAGTGKSYVPFIVDDTLLAGQAGLVGHGRNGKPAADL
jgi:hypothetical protein